MSTIALALTMNPVEANGEEVVQTPDHEKHDKSNENEHTEDPPSKTAATPNEREPISSTETPIMSTLDWELPFECCTGHDQTVRASNRSVLLQDENPLGAASSHTMASASSATSLPFESALSEFESSNFSAYFPTRQSTRAEEDELLEPEANAAALNFAMEHRIFLNAVLDLLNERDRIAPEVGMMDPIVLKSGPLKKASHLMNGVWKVKFVEIRRGMFSYYENASKDAEGELRRKNIPLQANSCRCRAVKLHQKALKFTPGGAIFELSVHGNRRLWMANSRQERQAWIMAIHNAMVGGSVTRGDSSNSNNHRGSLRGVSPRSPFKDDLRQYLRTQACLRSAKTKEEYVGGLCELVDNSLKVPVKWIAKQGVLATTDSTDNAFHEEAVHLSVEQLWRDLQRDSVSINGELFQGDCGHGPEKIMGALMRQILGTGRSGDAGRCDLSESQALTYARDILLSGNRTRSGGDAYFCVNTLCRNDDLVVVVPSGAQAEPVSIIVTQDDSHARSSSMYPKNEKSGWIKTRNKLQRKWRKLFFVLSEGTLSYYESALPRPHRLRGQFVMNDAAISIERKQPKPDGKPSNQYVLCVTTKDMKERLLLFESEDRLLDWTYALESTAKAKVDSEPGRKVLRRRSSFEAKGTNEDSTGLAEQATQEHVVQLGLDVDVIKERLAMYARKATSAVVVSIQASTAYNVCTVDPQGDERQDKWVTIHAQFLQSFRLVGGPNGRIMRGEEVVRVTISDCMDLVQEPQEPPEDPGTPTRRRKANRIFRKSNTSDDVDAGKTSDP